MLIPRLFCFLIIPSVLLHSLEALSAVTVTGGQANSYKHIKSNGAPSPFDPNDQVTRIALRNWRTSDPPFTGDIKDFFLNNSPFLYNIPADDPFNPSIESDIILTLLDGTVEPINNISGSFTIEYDEGSVVDDVISFTMIDYNSTGLSPTLGNFTLTFDPDTPLTGEYDLTSAEGTKLDPFVAFNLSDWRLNFSTDSNSSTSVLFLATDTEVAVDIIKTPEPTSTLSILALGTLGASSALKRKLKPSKSSEKETTKV